MEDFPALASACSATLVSQERKKGFKEHRNGISLLLEGLRRLEELNAEHSSEEVESSSATETRYRRTTHTLEFISFFSLILMKVLEEKEEGASGDLLVAVKSRQAFQLMIYPYNNLFLRDAEHDINVINRLEVGRQICEMLHASYRSASRDPSLRLSVAATVAAASLSVLSLNALLYPPQESPQETETDQPLVPILEELSNLAESWVSLSRQVFQVVKMHPEDFSQRIQIKSLGWLCKALNDSVYSVAQMATRLQASDFQQEQVAGIAISAFEAAASLHATHATLCQELQAQPGLADICLFMFLPLASVALCTHDLTLFISKLLHRAHILPKIDYPPVMNSGLKAVQAACKSSVAALSLPEPLLHFLCPCEVGSKTGDYDAGPLVYSFTSPHLTLMAYVHSFRAIMSAGNDKISDEAFFTGGVANLLQVLQVIDSFPDTMEKQLHGLIRKEPKYNIFSPLKCLGAFCLQLLPSVTGRRAISQPGLKRLISLLVLGTEIDKSEEPHFIVRSLTSLLNHSDDVSANKKDKCRRKAKALSHLPCGNLKCTKVVCPWEIQKRKLCTGCRTLRYCSEACQLADWQDHKQACRLIEKERVSRLKNEMQAILP